MSSFIEIMPSEIILPENFLEAAASIREGAKFKRDIRITKSCIDLDDSNGHIIITDPSTREEHSLKLTSGAATQLFGSMGIPPAYVAKTPSGLMRPHFHYHRDNMSDGTFLLRTHTGDNVIRAFLTESYKVLDNIDVIEALEGLHAENVNVDYRGISYDKYGDYLSIRAILPEHMTEGTSPDGDSNPIYAGFNYSNGETGNAPVIMDYIIYEQWCKNGAVRRIGGQPLMSYRHVGNRPVSFIRETIDNFDYIKENSEDALHKFVESKNEIVPNPHMFIRQSLRGASYATTAFAESVIEEFNRRPEGGSLYGVVSAMTKTAQSLHGREKLSIETTAGNLIYKRGEKNAKSN